MEEKHAVYVFYYMTDTNVLSNTAIIMSTDT